MAENIISVKNISKKFTYLSYNERNIKRKIINLFSTKKNEKTYYNALKNINFNVKKGEFLGIVGRNGGGKSTLLKIISNIYVPTKGSCKTKGSVIPFIELGSGFNPELTGKRNVYLQGALFGFSNKEIDKIYNEIISFAELEKFMEKKVKDYSSGMQVRLAFSIASSVEADILLIDEILAVGDKKFQEKCYDYFRNIHKTGKTVIFVSHDMNAVKTFCTRAIVIDDAKIIFDGKPSIAAEKYQHLFDKK